MKISFDFDDTITADPHRFSFIINALKAAGHTIIVLTGRPINEKEQIAEKLKEYKIDYDELITFPLEYDSQKAKFDSWLDIAIGNFKSSVIKEKKIDVVFDDHPIHVSIIKKDNANVLVLSPQLFRSSSVNDIMKLIEKNIKTATVESKPQYSSEDLRDIKEKLNKLLSYHEKIKEFFDSVTTTVQLSFDELIYQNVKKEIENIKNELKEKYSISVSNVTDINDLLSTLEGGV